MKRAPSAASAVPRLLRVELARARSAPSDTPSKRCASSPRLAAAISPRTPARSATARLDVAVEDLCRSAREQDLARLLGGVLQGFRPSGVVQQRCGVVVYDYVFGLSAATGQQSPQALGILLRNSAGDDAQRSTLEASVLGPDLELADFSAGQADRPRFTVQRDLIEPRAVHDQRLLDAHCIEGLSYPTQHLRIGNAEQL